jgi:thioredoxin 1
MIEVNSVNWTKEVKESGLPVLVDCSAEWCGPCKMLLPVLKDVESKFDGKIRFVKLDVDANEDLAQKLGISSIPCLIMFKDGHEADRIVGYSGVNPIVAWLENQEKGSTTNPPK